MVLGISRSHLPKEHSAANVDTNMHLNLTLLSYRGLNKQGYQCRRKYKAFWL